jgi:hypothetical protein
MGVCFTVRGQEINWESPEPGSYVDLSLANATEVLPLLGLSPVDGEFYGHLRGVDLRKRCNVALKNLTGNSDRFRPGVCEGGPGTGSATYLEMPRRGGYLRDRLEALSTLAERAGDLGVVEWS